MWHFDDTDILPGYRSDHSLVMLKLKFGKNIKHNTFWKFSCSLLRDKEYLDQVNTEIQNVTEEYAAGYYDRSTLHNIPKSEKSNKEIKTKEEKTEEDIKFLQENKSGINFITRKKYGRSSVKVKSKMGC